MSCGKCVLGSYFFLYHKSITITVSWAGQDIACTPETVEGSLFIETVLLLHWRSATQYIATVSMPGRKTKSRFNYDFHFNCMHDGADLCLRYFRLYAGSLCLFSAGPTVTQLERYSLILTLCEPISLFHQIIDSLFLCDNVLHQLEILYSSLTRLCFKRNPAESRAQIWRHNASKPSVASAGVHSLAVVLSLLIAPNFITRWYSLIKFCICIMSRLP